MPDRPTQTVCWKVGATEKYGTDAEGFYNWLRRVHGPAADLIVYKYHPSHEYALRIEGVEEVFVQIGKRDFIVTKQLRTCYLGDDSNLMDKPMFVMPFQLHRHYPTYAASEPGYSEFVAQEEQGRFNNLYTQRLRRLFAEQQEERRKAREG